MLPILLLLPASYCCRCCISSVCVYSVWGHDCLSTPHIVIVVLRSALHGWCGYARSCLGVFAFGCRCWKDGKKLLLPLLCIGTPSEVSSGLTSGTCLLVDIPRCCCSHLAGMWCRSVWRPLHAGWMRCSESCRIPHFHLRRVVSYIIHWNATCS